MTTADQPARVSAVPTSRKILCAVYGVISVAALIATWRQNLAYLDKPGRFLVDFAHDAKVTPSSRSLTVDLMLFGLAVTILMVLEARKWGVRYIWLYALGAFAIAISVTFPLFLIARELRMGASEELPRLRVTDSILLALAAVLMLGVTIWIEIP